MSATSTSVPFLTLAPVVDTIRARMEENEREHAVLQSMLSAAIPEMGLGEPQSGSFSVEPRVASPEHATTAVEPAKPGLPPNRELRALWKDIKGSEARNQRREHLKEFFRAGGHQKKSNDDISKMYQISKSLVSLVLAEAVKEGIAQPRAGAGGRATKH